MTGTVPRTLGRARIAEPDEGIGLDELALAARNHRMPLEAVLPAARPRGLPSFPPPTTPPPAAPAGGGGEPPGAPPTPRRPPRGGAGPRPAVTSRVLLECAGNGRA